MQTTDREIFGGNQVGKHSAYSRIIQEQYYRRLDRIQNMPVHQGEIDGRADNFEMRVAPIDYYPAADQIRDNHLSGKLYEKLSSGPYPGIRVSTFKEGRLIRSTDFVGPLARTIRKERGHLAIAFCGQGYGRFEEQTVEIRVPPDGPAEVFRRFSPPPAA